MSLLCTSLLLSGINGVLHDCFLVAGVYVRLMKINSVCIAAVLFSILNHSLFCSLLFQCFVSFFHLQSFLSCLF